jgi:hypothetical protein
MRKKIKKVEQKEEKRKFYKTEEEARIAEPHKVSTDNQGLKRHSDFYFDSQGIRRHRDWSPSF